MPFAVLIAGLPGTGKTYLGKELAKNLDARFLDSDIVREELQLEGEYDADSKKRVYEALRDKMTEHLHAKRSVVVESTFIDRDVRDTFIHEIEQTGSPYYLVLLTASEETLKQRLQQDREHTEADFAVFQKLKRRFDTIEHSHLELRSDQMTLDEMLAQAEEFIETTSGAT